MIIARQLEKQTTGGFTLLEMLVVISIVVLIAGMSIPLVSKPSDGLRLQATARDFLGALRLTRARAVARNVELALVIEVEERTYESADLPVHHFAPEIVAKLNVAAPERTTPSRGGFRFFPDGSSTGGDIQLSLNGKEVKICVNWLTGEARQSEKC